MDILDSLVIRFRNAERELQNSDLFLRGLFDIAKFHGAIKAQENTINKACEVYCDICTNKQEGCQEFYNDVNIFKLKLEEII